MDDLCWEALETSQYLTFRCTGTCHTTHLGHHMSPPIDLATKDDKLLLQAFLFGTWEVRLAESDLLRVSFGQTLA
jgi:hypothetical protein